MVHWEMTKAHSTMKTRVHNRQWSSSGAMVRLWPRFCVDNFQERGWSVPVGSVYKNNDETDPTVDFW